MAQAARVDPARGRPASRRRTRQRLLEKGREAFAPRGHAGANLEEDIRVPARISAGSLRPPSKDGTELFPATLEEHGRTFLPMLRDARRPRDGVPAQEVARRHSFETVFGVAEQTVDLLRVQLRERESEDSRLHRFLCEGRRRGMRGPLGDYRAPPGGAPLEGADVALAVELVRSTTTGTVVGFLELGRQERARRREPPIEGLVRLRLGGPSALPDAAPPRRRKED